jgi:hypothetical protein
MKSRHGSAVECGSADSEIVLLQKVDYLLCCGVHVEQPADKHGKRHGWASLGVIVAIYCAFTEKSVHNKPHFIHPLCYASVVANGIDGAVFRCPFNGSGLVRTPFCHTARIDIQVGGYRGFPIERAPDNHE